MLPIPKNSESRESLGDAARTYSGGLAVHLIMNLRLQTKVLGALAGVLLAMLAIGCGSAWVLSGQSEALLRLFREHAGAVGPQGVVAAERASAELVRLIWIVSLLTPAPSRAVMDMVDATRLPSGDMIMKDKDSGMVAAH